MRKRAFREAGFRISCLPEPFDRSSNVPIPLIRVFRYGNPKYAGIRARRFGKDVRRASFPPAIRGPAAPRRQNPFAHSALRGKSG